MFTKTDVIDSFHTLFRDRAALPEGLEDMWFNQAINRYELEIGEVPYDRATGEFGKDTPGAVINALAYLMKVMYCERELSRVNKINNIITTDIKLNGNGDTKRYTYNELIEERDVARDYINKMKTSWFGN